jgi:hypothetical protein
MGDGSNSKSSQKLKGHHSYASQTQDSAGSTSSKSYKDGSKSGSGGGKTDPDGVAPAAKGNTYLSNTKRGAY